jgi:hypothetical protein
MTPKLGDTWGPGFRHIRPFRKIINGFRLIFDVKVDVLVEAERPWNFEEVQARRGGDEEGARDWDGLRGAGSARPRDPWQVSGRFPARKAVGLITVPGTKRKVRL